MLDNLVRDYFHKKKEINQFYNHNKDYESLRNFLLKNYLDLIYKAKPLKKDILVKSLKYRILKILIVLEIQILLKKAKHKKKRKLTNYFQKLLDFNSDILKKQKFSLYLLFKDILKTILNNSFINYYYLFKGNYIFVINTNPKKTKNFLSKKKTYNFFFDENTLSFLFKDKKNTLKLSGKFLAHLKNFDSSISKFVKNKFNQNLKLEIFNILLEDLKKMSYPNNFILSKPHSIVGNLYNPQNIFLANEICNFNKFSLDHGNNIYSHKNPYCLYSSLGTDTFLCFSSIAKKNILHNLEYINKKKRKIFPKPIYLKNIFSSQNKKKEFEQIKTVKKILFIGHPLTFFRQIFYEKSYFIYFLELEKRICSYLSKKRHDVDYSIHEGALQWSNFIRKNVKKTIIGKAENYLEGYDLIIFTNTSTTLFNYVLKSTKPVLVFNCDLHLWRHKDLKKLKKRIGIVNLNYKKNISGYQFLEKDLEKAISISIKNQKEDQYYELIRNI